MMTGTTETRLHASDARHVVENALSAYCAAVDARDARGLGDLLAGAGVTFRGEHLDGDVAAFYDRAFAAGGSATRHVFTNLSVTAGPVGSDDEVSIDTRSGGNLEIAYRASYQRWERVERGPQCVALGTYEGSIRIRPPEAGTSAPPAGTGPSWSWTTHRVTTDPSGV